jgi:hypothetical protein
VGETNAQRWPPLVAVGCAGARGQPGSAPGLGVRGKVRCRTRWRWYEVVSKRAAGLIGAGQSSATDNIVRGRPGITGEEYDKVVMLRYNLAKAIWLRISIASG